MYFSYDNLIRKQKYTGGAIMGNFKNLSKSELELLMFRINIWEAPLSEYQLKIIKEVSLASQVA